MDLISNYLPQGVWIQPACQTRNSRRISRSCYSGGGISSNCSVCEGRKAGEEKGDHKQTCEGGFFRFQAFSQKGATQERVFVIELSR